MNKAMTWTELNNKLRDTTTAKEVLQMLQEEKRGLDRPRWKERIFQRMNKLNRAEQKDKLF